LSTEPDGNFEKQSNEPGDVDDASPVLKKLQARFGNRDGVGMIPERLGPQEIQWLGCWFMNCRCCRGGCGGGYALEFIAPIFDSKLDLWGRMNLATAPTRRSAIESFSATLFAHGVYTGMVLRDEDEASFDELLEVLTKYNHADCAEGTMEQIDPSGFSSSWPRKWLKNLQKLYPSLLLTLNALHRIAALNQSPADVPQNPFHPSSPREARTMPVGIRIFFFAGAIAGGITPGCAAVPFPMGCEPDPEMECEEEEESPF